MQRFLILLLVGFLAGSLGGCNPSPPSTGDPTRKISWAEFQKMDAEQRDDPYVLDNLDADARQKLAAAQKRKSR